MSTQIINPEIEQNEFNARKTAQYLIASGATLLDHCFNQLNQQILYFEHPELGDEGFVFALILTENGAYAVQTGFYDTGDFYRGSDYNYIWIESRKTFDLAYNL